MSVNTWVGTNDNYADTGNWALGAIPVNGDIVVFPAGNSQSCLSNVDRSAENLNLNRIVIMEGYGGTVGAAGAPLRCSVGSGTAPGIKVLGGNGFYYNAEIDTPSSGTATIYVNSRNRANALYLAGDDAVDRLIIARGGVNVNGTNGLTIGVLITTFVRDPMTDVVLTIQSGTTLPSALYFYGGQVESAASTHVNCVLGGKCRMIQTAGTMARVFVGPDAFYDHRADGNITEMQLMGEATFLRNLNDVTITDLFRHPGGNIQYAEELVTITTDHNPFGV